MRPEPWDPYGVCNVCKQIVTVEEWNARTHPCPGFWVSTGWGDIANPHNEPWKPGYRFCMKQTSRNVGRHNVHTKAREYYVYFEIDREGILQWTGGMKPFPETLEAAEYLYMRGRPGSNYFEEDAA